MADYFVGEIRMFGGNFAPQGWAFCDGTVLPIAQNDVLFNLIGTTYGGDGESTFALPDLRGRIPIHQGKNLGATYSLGESSGTETETLTTNNLPVHTHIPNSNSSGGGDSPAGSLWAKSTTGKPYATTGGPMLAFNAASVQPSGGNQPHDNMHPFLCVTYIISLFGIYPQQG